MVERRSPKPDVEGSSPSGRDLTEYKVKTMSKDNKFIQYFKGVRQEWGKVTWPEWAQVKVETVLVLLIVFVFTLIILFYDLIFSSVFGIFK